MKEKLKITNDGEVHYQHCYDCHHCLYYFNILVPIKMSSEIEKMSENLNNFSKSWSIIYFTRGKDTKWEKVVRKMVFSGVKERKGVQEEKERKEVILVYSDSVTGDGFLNEDHCCSS